MEKGSSKRVNPKIYLIAAGFIVALILAVVLYYILADFSKSDKVEYVYIDSDDTQDSVFAKITPIATSHGLSGFCTMARHSGYAENIRTGRYAINPGESAVKVFRRLRSGLQTPVTVVIPEVRTMDRLAGSLSRKLMMDSADVAMSLADSAFLAAYGCDTATIAALFIPNSYEMYWNVSLPAFMERMKREHAAFWNGSRRALADSLGMTVWEVATLASIIDEETADDGEKPMIAGMYINRLVEGMPLQADPTIKFALKNFSIRRIYRNQLFVDSPYNTYLNPGLPPGPIKIPSVAGIDAVLNYTHHNYLYMCAKEDFSGKHNFASTYGEHLRNARKYSKALNERGIK